MVNEFLGKAQMFNMVTYGNIIMPSFCTGINWRFGE